MTAFFLFVLALIACHRIWHREDIFAWPLAALKLGGSWTKPLWCASCSPVWIGVILALAWPLLPQAVVWTLAAYPVVRLLAAAYKVHWDQFLPDRQAHLKQAFDDALQRSKAGKSSSGAYPVSPPLAGCTACDAAAAASAATIAPGAEPAAVRAAATAEVTVAVAADAPEDLIKGAAGLVTALQRQGVVSRLLGMGDGTPGGTDVRLRGASQDLRSEDVLFVSDSAVKIADVLVAVGPRAQALAAEASMHGVLLVVPTGGLLPFDFQAVLIGDLAGEADALASRVLDHLLGTPSYRARKDVLRRSAASRPAVS